ncbi:MAG: FHA domain-containing protein [Chloroflexota bacterium]
MSEQVCENCGKVNPETESYCTACGHALSGERTVLNTQPLSVPGLPQPQLRWGTAFFEDRMILQLEIKGTDQVIRHELGLDCVVGRTHEDVVPDLDLAPFNALERGVSRRHARLTRQSLTVMVQDLGSVNGTFLNGTRLVPFQPRVLRHDDELVLGRLALRVSFLRSVVAKPDSGDGPQQEALASEEPLISPPDAPLQVGPPEPVVSPPQDAAQLVTPPEEALPPSPPAAKRDTDELNDTPAANAEDVETSAAPGSSADSPPASPTP